MVEAEKFSEMLDARLAEYLRGLISNEEVIKELLKMAQELKANAGQASELGLTEEEQAFYDALTKPQAVRDFYENSQLVAMAKELTEALRSSKTIDWRQKESARAKMRSMVKRLLKSTNTHQRNKRLLSKPLSGNVNFMRIRITKVSYKVSYPIWLSFLIIFICTQK